LIAPPLATAEADRARERAGEILSERRFQEPDVPRPLQGPLDALGRALEKAVGWLDSTFGGLVDWVPGGPGVGWTALSALVLAGAVLLALRIAEPRGRDLERQRAEAQAGERPDPAALEEQADRAERAGDLELAIRLRFRAGVLRLEERGDIDLRPPLTSGILARRLRSPEFEALARRFDEIAYGGRAAEPRDAALAKQVWGSVVKRGAAA
jgi:hypothetical protein